MKGWLPGIALCPAAAESVLDRCLGAPGAASLLHSLLDDGPRMPAAFVAPGSSKECCAHPMPPALGSSTPLVRLCRYTWERVPCWHPAFPVLGIRAGNREIGTPLSLDICGSCHVIIKEYINKYKNIFKNINAI